MMDDCGDFAGRSAAALPSHSLAHSLEPLKCRVTPSLTLTRIHNGSRSFSLSCRGNGGRAGPSGRRSAVAH